MYKLNTHYYDGKLKIKYQNLKHELEDQIIQLDQCWIEIKQLVMQETKGAQRKKANMILNKLRSNDHGNYDKANDIHIHELIPYVWTKVREYDNSGKRVFIEQLIDITRGMCPQGRVTRLLQVVEDTIEK